MAKNSTVCWMGIRRTWLINNSVLLWNAVDSVYCITQLPSLNRDHKSSGFFFSFFHVRVIVREPQEAKERTVWNRAGICAGFTGVVIQHARDCVLSRLSQRRWQERLAGRTNAALLSLNLFPSISKRAKSGGGDRGGIGIGKRITQFSGRGLILGTSRHNQPSLLVTTNPYFPPFMTAWVLWVVRCFDLFLHL